MWRRRIKWSAAAAAALMTIYVPFVHHTDVNQVAIMHNVAKGSITIDNTAGFTLSAPWVLVARIDIRPNRVCVEGVARVANCRLARFVPQQLTLFVDREGFRYYWFANRLSFNWGHAQEYRGARNYLRGYAFSQKAVPFVQVMDEYHE